MLVFVSSKQGCEDLSKSLNEHTSIPSGAIHGDKDQTDRRDTRNDSASFRVRNLRGDSVRVPEYDPRLRAVFYP